MMKSVKRKFILFCTILFCILGLLATVYGVWLMCACMQGLRIVTQHQTAMVRMAEKHVTGYINYGGPHHSEFQMMEKDDYDRYMFEVQYSNGDLLGYVIVQFETEKEVYFYDEICAISVEDGDDVSEEGLEKFKEQNDWDQPLCEEK